MFRYETRVPGSGELQVATAKGWSDGFSRFPGYRTKQWGKNMGGGQKYGIRNGRRIRFLCHSFL